MFGACKSVLYGVLESSKATKKEKWVKENQGQCIITAGQILWTMDCEKALSDPDTAKRAMRQLKKKWVSYLTKLTSITRSKLSKIERNKTVALITIEVHARDVIDKLGRAGCTAATDFEWVSQLRFYWDRDADDCVVRQVLSVFKYGYEYQVSSFTAACETRAALAGLHWAPLCWACCIGAAGATAALCHTLPMRPLTRPVAPMHAA